MMIRKMTLFYIITLWLVPIFFPPQFGFGQRGNDTTPTRVVLAGEFNKSKQQERKISLDSLKKDIRENVNKIRYENTRDDSIINSLMARMRHVEQENRFLKKQLYIFKGIKTYKDSLKQELTDR